MSAFASAFTQFFAALTLLFTAFSKLCGIADNLATVGYEASGEFMDEARAKRTANAKLLLAQAATPTLPPP